MTVNTVIAPSPAPVIESDRRQFVLGGALLALAATAYGLKPRRVINPLPEGTLERVIPKTVGRYQFLSAGGVVVPPSDEVTERIYDQVLARVYGADGMPAIMLLIAYGSAQDVTLQLHRPEVCYPAQGFELKGSRNVPIDLGPVGSQQGIFTTAERGDRVEQVFFWTRVGGDFPTSNLQEKITVIKSNLRGRLPDGILVRASMLTLDPGLALATIEQFNKDLIAGLQGQARKLLLGPAG